MFSTSAGILIVAVIYGAVIIKESLRLPNKGGSKKKNNIANQDKAQNCMNIIQQSVLYILEGFRTVVTCREGWRRALVLLGVFQYICYICGYTGTEGSQRQYFLENKYKWTEEEIGTYLFNYRIACWLGLWLVVPFLTNVFKLTDSIIAVIAVVTASTGITDKLSLSSNDFSPSLFRLLPACVY